jgi:uncharacterized protein (DUF4415 family)
MAEDDFSALFAGIRDFGGTRKSVRAICAITRSTSKTRRECSTATPTSVDQIDMAKSGTKSSDISKAAKSQSHARSGARSAGSSRHGAQAGTNDEKITVVSRYAPNRGKTDWAALDALTDEEIEASIANDPDWQEFKDLDWSEVVLVIPPKKRAISIRLDEDVLDYFKKEGAGYQRRMNAVLRSYMQQKRKKRA